MTYHLTPEQYALLRLSKTSWERRGQAKEFGLSFGEESITETILLDLARSYPGKVLIVPFNKSEEGRLGADWAWAFVSAHGTHIYPMLVQAKALDFGDRCYPEIKRNIGKLSPPVRQIDRLIDTAAGLGWPAIYAFYNHLDDPSRILFNCGSLALSAAPRFAPAWGITIADADRVRGVLNDQTFDTHRTHSMALHCLLCSGGTGVRPSEGSAGLALSGIRRLRTQAEPDGMAVRSSELRPVLDETLEQLPDIFSDALVLSERKGEESDVFRRRIAERYPSVAGVVILRDATEEGYDNR